MSAITDLKYIVVGMTICLPSFAMGGVLWDSHGFQSPQYHLGPLTGQDGWENLQETSEALCEITFDEYSDEDRQVLFMKGGYGSREEFAWVERSLVWSENAETGRYTLTFRVFPLSASGVSQIPKISLFTESNVEIVALSNYSGYFVTKDGAPTLMPIIAKKWYEVKIVGDFIERECEITIQQLDAKGAITLEVRETRELDRTAAMPPARLEMKGVLVENSDDPFTGGAYLTEMKVESDGEGQ